VRRTLETRLASLEDRRRRSNDPGLLAAVIACRQALLNTLSPGETLEQRICRLAERLAGRDTTAADGAALAALPESALTVLRLDAEGLVQMYQKLFKSY
jgi:hypothetical protein